MITQRIILKLQEVAAHERMLADHSRSSEALKQLSTDEQFAELARVGREADKLADEAIEAIRILGPHVTEDAPERPKRRGLRLLPGGRS